MAQEFRATALGSALVKHHPGNIVVIQIIKPVEAPASRDIRYSFYVEYKNIHGSSAGNRVFREHCGQPYYHCQSVRINKQLL